MINPWRHHIISLQSKQFECLRAIKKKQNLTYAVLHKHGTREEHRIWILSVTLFYQWFVHSGNQMNKNTLLIYTFMICMRFVYKFNPNPSFYPYGFWFNLASKYIVSYHMKADAVFLATSTTSINLLLPHLQIKASCLTPLCAQDNTENERMWCKRPWNISMTNRDE